jgi:integrase/recombinase XerD
MTDITTNDLLRQRMIEDMTARNLSPASHKTRLRAYKRFAAWLQRSPDTATADDVRLFQLHLAETGVGIVTRNATMTGLRFLFRVTLRRHDLAAEIYHIKEPQKTSARPSPSSLPARVSSPGSVTRRPPCSTKAAAR